MGDRNTFIAWVYISANCAIGVYTMHSDCMPWIDDTPDKVNADCSLKYICWRNRAEYQKLDHQYAMY